MNHSVNHGVNHSVNLSDEHSAKHSVLFCFAIPRARVSEKGEERHGIKFGPEAAHLSFFENPGTRTTSLQALFEAVLR